jgi:hypothetical protein
MRFGFDLVTRFLIGDGVDEARVNAVLFACAKDHLINFSVAGRGDVRGNEVFAVANFRGDRRGEDTRAEAGKINEEKKGE